MIKIIKNSKTWRKILLKKYSNTKRVFNNEPKHEKESLFEKIDIIGKNTESILKMKIDNRKKNNYYNSAFVLVVILYVAFTYYNEKKQSKNKITITCDNDTINDELIKNITKIIVKKNDELE